MSRFCTRCGARNEDDAGFCEQCGAALHAGPQSGSTPAAGPGPSANPSASPPPRPPRGGGAAPDVAPLRAARRRGLPKLVWAAAAGVVVLAGAGTAAWMFLGRLQPPTQAEIDAIGAQWLGAHQADLAGSACLSNFVYGADPVYVSTFSMPTRNWLDVLVKAGVYAPPTVSGPYQLRYTHGPQAATAIRDGRLCLAQGPRIAKISMRPVTLPQLQAAGLPWLQGGKSTLDRFRELRITIAWQQQAAWAQWPQVRQEDPQFDPAPKEKVLLLHTRAGWKDLSDPASRQYTTPALRKLAGQPEPGAAGGQSAPAAAAMPEHHSGMFSWLSGLFSFGDPARKLPGEFYQDIQSGHPGAAYALLGPQMQILGPDAMKMLLSAAREQLDAAGGLDRVEVQGESADGAHGKIVRFVIKLHNGEQHPGALRAREIHGKWYIDSFTP